jgi:hypothetical protein
MRECVTFGQRPRAILMVHAAAGLTNLKSEMEHGSGFDADGYRVEASSNISRETLAGSMKLPASFSWLSPHTAEIGRANARASKKLFIKLSIEQ